MNCEHTKLDRVRVTQHPFEPDKMFGDWCINCGALIMNVMGKETITLPNIHSILREAKDGKK